MPKNEEFYGMSILYFKKILLLKKKKGAREECEQLLGRAGGSARSGSAEVL